MLQPSERLVCAGMVEDLAMRWRISVSSVWWDSCWKLSNTRPSCVLSRLAAIQQQLVHHRATVMAGAMMASRNARSASRRTSTAEKSARRLTESACPRECCFHGLLGRELSDVPRLHVIRLLQVPCGAADARCGFAGQGRRGGQVVDFALHHRQAGCGGVIMRPSSCAMKRSAVWRCIGLKHRPSRSPPAPRRIHPTHLAPGLAQGVVAVDSQVHPCWHAPPAYLAKFASAASNGTPSRWCSNSASEVTRAISGACRSQQQPGRVLLAGGDAFPGALLFEGGASKMEVLMACVKYSTLFTGRTTRWRITWAMWRSVTRKVLVDCGNTSP